MVTYVDGLKDSLMLYWGIADNNVHSSNMMQLTHQSGPAKSS